ncbi:Putative epoxide hydrolase [Psilocybe cubensis]|uniref:Epoxide hydrolase N-terminal domain-containing protein n=2 Tax=Psilocybe cubensis TaxID=181762 RepID=A0A8H7Y628_PSICU|nr:Putative epoxide hydrolase [Psilocybe cubensis]KAH9484409.1 Putative epoxide hydrolase [Psilocybe cubensis]
MATAANPTQDSTSIIPFKIQVSDDQIEHLNKKLALVRLPDELENAGRDYGVPLGDIQRLVARWKSGYDWRTHEKQLNDELPQFQGSIDVEGFGSLKVHFVHKKSEVENAIPLLFVHGWPGSFVEVRKILPLLTQEIAGQPSFHVVAFSLPGYGFSEAPKKKGFKINQFAEVGHKLMLSLGYKEYVAQGGDWGSRICQRIASLYGGTHCKAWHTNFPLPLDTSLIRNPPTLFSHPWLYLSGRISSYTPAEKAGLERTAWFIKEGHGYAQEHSTQPQTLGYSLADSPVGLLAWIYEKLVNWTDNYPWDDDEAGPAASLRIYYEFHHETDTDRPKPPTIPAGASFFPKELHNLPRKWTRTPYRKFEAEHDSGGHFAAHEKPNELVQDLRRMFGKGGIAEGIVKGKTGYKALSRL